MGVFDCVIWTIGFFVFVSFLLGSRGRARENKPIHIAIVLQTILLFVAQIVFVFVAWRKLHLLWVAPASVICGWILGFVVVPVPVIGDLLRNIALIFAHAFYVGTEWEIGRLPWELSAFRAIAARTKREL